MKVLGTWKSNDGLILSISKCSKNTVSGRLESNGNFSLKEKKFNGIILKNDESETIFCFYIRLSIENGREFDYLLTLGKMAGKKNLLSLVIAKFHFKDNLKIPIDIKRIKLVQQSNYLSS